MPREFENLPATPLLKRGAAESGPGFVLRWMGDEETGELMLSGGDCLVGRRPKSEVCLTSESVSREHAVFTVSGTTLTLRDLGSTNGTRLNGRELSPRAVVELSHGDVVHAGDVAILVGAPSLGPSLEGAPSGMQRLWETVKLVAPTDLSVIILGETGVGKERVAEKIHAQSMRQNGPLVRVNCAALAETLLDAQLFGHAKGAFTGAVAAQKGLLQCADGGTLFLDEIGEMGQSMQAKLLRAIEQKVVTPLGGSRDLPVDFRVVAATHRDLNAMVEAGEFRQDLYYRLNGLSLSIPPLRDRKGELRGFVRQILHEITEKSGRTVSIAPAAHSALAKHNWPGNIRELKAVLERALVLARGSTITEEHLGLSSPAESQKPDSHDERAHLLQVLSDCAFNQTTAAQVLGISRATLIRRMDRYGLPRPQKK